MVAIVGAPLLALPWYLDELGPKQFGLIGFITMLQALLSLLDAGVSQVLVREVTLRLDDKGMEHQRTGSLILGFERIYWTFAITAGLLVSFIASDIAEHWLNLEDLPLALGEIAIYGGVGIFIAQFPGSIYRSVLIGAQRHVSLNLIMSSFAILRHVGGVAAITAQPELKIYLIWHTATILLETIVRRTFAWRLIRIPHNDVRVDMQDMYGILRTAGAMSGITLVGVLTLQIDKLLLSRLVTIEEFAYYTIAATIAFGSLQLINPLIQTALPQAIQLRANPKKLHHLSLNLFKQISFMTILAATGFWLWGAQLLNFWLKNPELLPHILPILVTLLAGTALNAIYNVGYINWLALGNYRRILHVNVTALVIASVLIPIFVSWQGTIGGAFGWVAINFIGLVFSLGWIKPTKNDRKD